MWPLLIAVALPAAVQAATATSSAAAVRTALPADARSAGEHTTPTGDGPFARGSRPPADARVPGGSRPPADATALAGGAGATAAGAAVAPATPVLQLRILGGLSALNQFRRHEEPFWSQSLARLSGGRYDAEIVPFDRSGIRSAELLTMARLGAVPFANVTLGQAGAKDPELGAPDLPGLNPDFATLQRHVAAYRPHLRRLLRERHGLELLAVYVYPAQMLFCRQPLRGLDDLRGRRVRTSGTAQSDWVEALGARPLTTPFAELVEHVRSGSVDCAITGSMSGFTVGLHQFTGHIHPLAVTWGLSVFVAHRATWLALPAPLRALLERELPRVEAAVWDEARRETDEGLACVTGAAGCAAGPPGRMVAVRPGATDERRRVDALERTVLPRWVERCGAPCAAAWNHTLASGSGLTAVVR